jgi:hypothetical protein
VATLASRLADLATAIGARIKAIETTNASQGRTGTTAFGYSTGAGGTVTQATSKSTAVTINKLTGEITLNAAALAAAGIVSFTLNNSNLVAGDQLVCTHHATGTFGAYTINGRVTGNGTAIVTVRNNSSSSLSEAIVVKFSIIKAVNA